MWWDIDEFGSCKVGLRFGSPLAEYILARLSPNGFIKFLMSPPLRNLNVDIFPAASVV